MPLEHLSGNQARHVFLFNFPRHVREGRLHAYGSPLFPSHAHTLLPTLPLLLTFPPAKMFSSSPLPCFPILFAQNRRHYKPHRRFSSSSNTQPTSPLTPSPFRSTTLSWIHFLKGGKVCLGGAQMGSGFASVGVVQMLVASPPATHSPDYTKTPWTFHSNNGSGT